MNEQAWKEQAARDTRFRSLFATDMAAMEAASALYPIVQQAIAAERGGPVAPIWRSGVGFGVTVLDIVRKQFSKTRSPAVARFNAALDEALQAAFDMSRSSNVENYEEAQAVEKNIAAAIRSLKESDIFGETSDGE